MGRPTDLLPVGDELLSIQNEAREHFGWRLGVLVIMSGLIYHLVAVAVLTLRGIPWLPTDAIAHWDISGQLVRRFFELIYSSLMSLPVGFLLLKLDPLFGYGLPVRTARSGAT